MDRHGRSNDPGFTINDNANSTNAASVHESMKYHHQESPKIALICSPNHYVTNLIDDLIERQDYNHLLYLASIPQFTTYLSMITPSALSQYTFDQSVIPIDDISAPFPDAHALFLAQCSDASVLVLCTTMFFFFFFFF